MTVEGAEFGAVNDLAGHEFALVRPCYSKYGADSLKRLAIASTSVGPNAVFSSRRWISMTISPNERLMPDYATKKSLLQKSDPPAKGGAAGGHEGVGRNRPYVLEISCPAGRGNCP